MIVYRKSVDVVDKRTVDTILMGKLVSTNFQQRKEFTEMQEANVEKYLIRYVKDKGGL